LKQIFKTNLDSGELLDGQLKSVNHLRRKQLNQNHCILDKKKRKKIRLGIYVFAIDLNNFFYVNHINTPKER
jgi:hypothetical protein